MHIWLNEIKIGDGSWFLPTNPKVHFSRVQARNELREARKDVHTLKMINGTNVKIRYRTRKYYGEGK